MSIDGHEVVPQRLVSLCGDRLLWGRDPRSLKGIVEGGSKVNTDQDETRAPTRLPDVRPRMSVKDWGGLQFRRRSTQFEPDLGKKNSVVTGFPSSAIGDNQPPSLILRLCLPAKVKPRIGVIFPVLWVSPFGEINSARPFKSRCRTVDHRYPVRR